MKVTDTMRVDLYVARYDFWLDMKEVPLRVRSGLRQELRANLLEAAQDVGVAAALAGAGEPRALAAEAADVAIDPTRPTWLRGCSWAVAALALHFLVWLPCAFSFVEGVRASGVTHEVRGSLLLFPGEEVVVSFPERGGFLVGTAGFPWLMGVLAVAAFVAGARPWRLAIPRERRRERPRLLRMPRERLPRWARLLLAGELAIIALATFSGGVESRGSDTAWSMDFSRPWVGLAAAVVTFLVIGRPWKRD